MNKIDDMIDYFLYEKGESIKINGQARLPIWMLPTNSPITMIK